MSEAIDACPWTITEVVRDGARGVDWLGERFAATEGLPATVFEADWNKHEKSAGPIRNKVEWVQWDWVDFSYLTRARLS